MVTRVNLPVIISHDCTTDVDSLRFVTPRERLAALADDGTFAEHDARRPSPYLARYGIAPQDDDGVVAATLRIGGREFECAAQDGRFLRGSVGEQHGRKVAAAVARARATGRALLLLAASGGVRLHEANAAEIALARALRALCDARAAGTPALAIGVGDVFGGMSVLVAACNRVALTPVARFGLSGPRVIETARGSAELDAGDHAAVAALFGAPARVAAGIADGVDDNAVAMRTWIAQHLAAPASFAADVLAMQHRLQSLVGDAGPAIAVTLDAGGELASLPAFRGDVDAASLSAADARLLALPASVRRLTIHEDSRGHEAGIRAERVGLSRYLAHHALVLALLRARGVRIVGVLEGTGHSAAFFANALQADALYALPGSRVVAMEPQALARITGMDAAHLARAVDDDPLLGHDARHLAALGALTLIDARQDAR